eukprot:88827-Chlamydomonas_euryale.AAC.1
MTRCIIHRGHYFSAQGLSQIPLRTCRKPVAASASPAGCRNLKACGTCGYECGYGCVVWHMRFKQTVGVAGFRRAGQPGSGRGWACGRALWGGREGHGVVGLGFPAGGR